MPIGKRRMNLMPKHRYLRLSQFTFRKSQSMFKDNLQMFQRRNGLLKTLPEQ